MLPALNLEEKTRRLICKHRGLLSARELHCELLQEANAAGYSQSRFMKELANPLTKKYEDGIALLTNQVKAHILFKDEKFATTLYNDFIDEADTYYFTKNEFENEIIEPVRATIDWELLNDCRIIERRQEKSLPQLLKTSPLPNLGIQLEIDNYVDKILTQLMQDGVVCGKSIESIINRLNLSGITFLSNTLTQIETKLAIGDFKGPNKVPDDLKEKLIENNWYKKEQHNKLLGTQSSLDTKKKSLFLPIVLSLTFIFSFFQCKQENKVETKDIDCNLLESNPLSHTIDTQFWSMLIAFVVLFFLPHFSKRLKKPPLFIWTSYSVIAIALVILSIIYGFQTDKLTKYDSDSANKTLDWFKFSEWLNFPINQIKLNTQAEHLNEQGAILPNNVTIKKNERNKKNLHLIVVDRTLSGDESKEFRKITNSDKMKLINYLKNSNAIDKNTTKLSKENKLRDLVAASIFPKILSKNNTADIEFGSIFIHDGISDSLVSAIDSTIIDLNNSTQNNNFADQFFKAIKKNENSNQGKGYLARTDYNNVFIQLRNWVNQYANEYKREGYTLHLYVISDFLHEIDPVNDSQAIVNIDKVERAIVDFAGLPNWKNKQVVLFKHPLYNENKGQTTANELINIFDKAFDRQSHIVEIDLKSLISKGDEIVTDDLFFPITDTNQSIRFHYSEQYPYLNAFSNIKIANEELITNNPDTLILAISENGLVKKSNFFYYDYILNNCKNGTKQVNPKATAEICEKIILKRVYQNAMLQLSFNKKNLDKISAPLYLELYSNKTKSRKRYMLDFCPIIPNATNYMLIISYVILFLALFTCTFFPLHFWYVKEYILIQPKKRVSYYFVFSFVLLAMLTCFFLISLINYLDINISNEFFNQQFKPALTLFTILLFSVIAWQFRYYYSKYLFHQHEDIYRNIRKSRCIFVKYLVRGNNYESVYNSLLKRPSELSGKKYIDMPERRYK